MIDLDYVQQMARYNSWQNEALAAATGGLSEDALREDRGAFFGSIMGTLNHLLWADRLWMSRFDGWAKPEGNIPQSVDLYPTHAAWEADRRRADDRISHWASRLRPAELRGDLTWFSGALGREVSKPIKLCVMHMFNHQTHHRGQLHAMLTSAGVTPEDTDLFAMPEESQS